MNQRIVRVLAPFLLLLTFVSNAQTSDKEKFLEALYLIDENRYSSALPLLYDVYQNDKNNANINYNLGLSILNSFNEKEKEGALPYLLEATKNVSPNYTYLDPKEKKAPVDAWFYLGKAQHNDYQFLEAIESYNKFGEYINEKHYLYKDIQKNINMSKYAKNAILNPVKIETTNLGEKLNGFYPDFSPVVRIDESAVYFTSRRLREDSSNYQIYDPIDGMLFEDLYVSFNDDGVWSEPYPLNINTEGHEATVNLSVDGQTLYIYKDINGNGELFESKLESDSAGFEIWSEPKKLGSNINTKAYETHVTVTPDGRTLYFISDREGGFGGKDIYYCNLLPTGNWALAQNAGPILNSEHNEDGVFMHPDGKTMYFSSEGHKSMGGYDILYSINTDSGWTEPANMGYPINSVDDDVFFVTTPDGKRAYFSSFKEEGYGEKDIYMLQLLDAEESGVTLYRGEFTFVDRRTPPSGAQVTITDNYTGELVGVYTPRERDGQFSAILIPNTSYHFVYEADAYESYEEDIYVTEAGNYQEIYKDIALKPVRVGDGLTKITPAPLALASIKGGIVKRGEPIKGMKILLLNEGEDLLNQTTSDNVGEFQFAELDPSQTYLIRVVSEDGNPLQGLDVEVENDKGEILPFEPLDDTTYIFIPSIQPFEFYGISKSRELAGTIKNAGAPVQGLNVRLEDEREILIQEEETDEYGEFNFQKLDLDQEYRIVFEGDFPDDPDILITNDVGQQMKFKKVRRGVYEYIPITSPMPKALLSDIGGAVTSAGEPVKNLQVLLLDADETLLSSAATDNVGKFNFFKLDLTRRYFIRFEGDYPEDLKMVVANDQLDLLLFRKIETGLYQYDPVFVRLEDSKSQVLGKEITENVGEMNYKKLKLDQYYQIIYEGNYPDDAEILIKNDKGEEFIFRKKSEGVYEYVPKIQPTVTYVLKDGDTPLKNTYVRLEDSNRTLIERLKTDDKGKFKYKKLPLNEEFWLVVENNNIDLVSLVITDEMQQELNLIKRSRNEFQHIPLAPMPKAILSNIGGTVVSAGLPVKDLKVLLLTAEQKLIDTSTTDNVGKFNFAKLDLTKQYFIKFEGDFPSDLSLAIVNDKSEELIFRKIETGLYLYDPVFVRLEDAKSQVLGKEIAENVGEMNYKKLKLDQYYQIIYEGNYPDNAEIMILNDEGEEFAFKKVKDGVYEYVPKGGFALTSYTIDVKDSLDYKETYPRPNELKDVVAYFQKYFPYNAKDISETNKEFVAFISDIAELVKQRGDAKIIITSSASKVPTRTWKTNTILTKKRAYDTKALLERVFKKKGITPDQYNFVDINTLITGPEYKGDYLENMKTYEKYQYVRIFIK